MKRDAPRRAKQPKGGGAGLGKANAAGAGSGAVAGAGGTGSSAAFAAASKSKAAPKQPTPNRQNAKRKTPVRRKGPIKLASPARAEAYEIVECLGSGTYGKVYKVRRKADGAILVLKQVSMEGLSVRLFPQRSPKPSPYP